MKETFRCLLQTVSPVHVGCDEIYEPMGFVLDDQTLQLTVFDPFTFLAQMDPEDRKRFSQICAQGTIESILEIYKFLQGRKTTGRPIGVSNGFVKHYHETIAIPLKERQRIQQELNRFTIARTSFNTGDVRPYIPGSGIKGALRTAYLNNRAGAKKVHEQRGKGAAKQLEEAILEGSFNSDPFRLVKVSDFRPVGEIKTTIVYAVNEKKIPSRFKARGPYQILDVIEPGARFEGTISVETPEKGANIRTPDALDRLLKSAVGFYTREKKREDAELKGIGVAPISLPDSNSSVPIRVGRHSGAESMTIEGYRNIKINLEKGKKRYDDHATTIWLASDNPKPRAKQNLKAFGWAVLQNLTQDMAQRFEATELAWKRTYNAEQESRLAEDQRQMEKLQAEERRKAQELQEKAMEEKQKQQEQENKKAQLEAMTPEQRDIATLKDPSISENLVVEIYGRIGEYSSKGQKELALALKEYWGTQGKWVKRSCSKKQWQKVQKIKDVLGED